MVEPKCIEALIFDFDGVVVDSEPIHCDCFRQVMKAEYGLDFTRETYFQRYLAYTDAECFHAMLEEHDKPCDAQVIARLTARKTQLVHQAFATSIPPMAGVVELMRQARSAGLAVGICSGALRSEIEAAARTVGARPFVQIIISAEDVQVGKPDPAGYMLARAQLSRCVGRELPGAQCLAIEDAPAGIRAAKAAGLRVLAVTNSLGKQQLAAADRVVDSLADVTIAELHQLAGQGR